MHSQQKWFYMGTRGEITVDQAHRGYTVATDELPRFLATPASRSVFFFSKT